MPRRAAPLRQQTFRIVMLGFVFACGLTGMLVGFLAAGDRVPDVGPLIAIMVATFVVSGGVGVALGLLIQRKLVGDRIEIAFREPGGKWRHGRIDPSTGSARLQPYLWQIRIPKGEPIELTAVEVGPDTGRKPSARDWWSTNPQMRIVDLTSNERRLEIGGLPAHLDELRERLGEVAA